MFLTGQNGFIKAYAGANECKQYTYTEMIDTALPTVMTESIFTTAAIDAREK